MKPSRGSRLRNTAVRTLREMGKFEVCICVVEKMNGSDYVRFKEVIRRFNGYADALKYAGETKKNVVHQTRGKASANAGGNEDRRIFVGCNRA